MGILSQLSDEQLEKSFEQMRRNDPESNDFIEAIMNRLTALEKRVRELEQKP